MAENKKTNDKTSNEETQQQKRCFVIMPFSDPEGYAKGHFRKIYEQIIKPAIENAGYVAYRVDENGVSDLITTKIFQAILDCEMAICDLSSRNPNVLYELGIRHAFDKPVVLINDDKTERIFDIQGISTIEYRRERLYDEVIEDQKKISEAIAANENNSSSYSIINMIKLQEVAYDKNYKDVNPHELNNAILMRVIDALDRVEQIQNNYNKPMYLKKTIRRQENEMEDDIRTINFQLNALKSTVNACNSVNASPDELSQIEDTIWELKESILTCLNKNPTVKQQQMLDNRYDEAEALLTELTKIGSIEI